MVKILEGTTKSPVTKIGECSGICYHSNITSPEANYNRGLDCLKSNHGRTLEVVDVELYISGYSARVIREWYTHIGGTPTRLQASTRYINYDNFECYVPNSIENSAVAKEEYEQALNKIRSSMKFLLKLNIPKEDVANLLPIGYLTEVYDKRNLRNLIEMSHQRLCSRAYGEYRQLMKELMKELSDYSEEWKYIVENYFCPKCDIIGKCPEKKSCGRY